MSIEHLTTEEIAAELDRRKAAQREEKLARIAVLEAELAALRAETAQTGAPRDVKAKRTPYALPSEDAVLAVLEANGVTTAVGVDRILGAGNGVKAVAKVLSRLVIAGKVKRLGKARSTAYELA